jgi:hypothetical protein
MTVISLLANPWILMAVIAAISVGGSFIYVKIKKMRMNQAQQKLKDDYLKLKNEYFKEMTRRKEAETKVVELQAKARLKDKSDEFNRKAKEYEEDLDDKNSEDIRDALDSVFSEKPK